MPCDEFLNICVKKIPALVKVVLLKRHLQYTLYTLLHKICIGKMKIARCKMLTRSASTLSFTIHSFKNVSSRLDNLPFLVCEKKFIIILVRISCRWKKAARAYVFSRLLIDIFKCAAPFPCSFFFRGKENNIRNLSMRFLIVISYIIQVPIREMKMLIWILHNLWFRN